LGRRSSAKALFLIGIAVGGLWLFSNGFQGRFAAFDFIIANTYSMSPEIPYIFKSEESKISIEKIPSRCPPIHQAPIPRNSVK
jgi:hypothetical protein